MDCIFCKIIEGELPCCKVYEDRRIIAFLDINPVNKGHLLILPKEHYPNFLETPKDVLKDLVSVSQDLAKAVMEAVGAGGFNLIVNNGRIGGQLVDHVHFHLIPRFSEDNLHHWAGKTSSEEEMKRVMENIKRTI